MLGGILRQLNNSNLKYFASFQDDVRSNVGFSSLGKMDRHKKMRMQTKGNPNQNPKPNPNLNPIPNLNLNPNSKISGRCEI